MNRHHSKPDEDYLYKTCSNCRFSPRNFTQTEDIKSCYDYRQSLRLEPLCERENKWESSTKNCCKCRFSFNNNGHTMKFCDEFRKELHLPKCSREKSGFEPNPTDKTCETCRHAEKNNEYDWTCTQTCGRFSGWQTNPIFKQELKNPESDEGTDYSAIKMPFIKRVPKINIDRGFFYTPYKPILSTRYHPSMMAYGKKEYKFEIKHDYKFNEKGELKMNDLTVKDRTVAKAKSAGKTVLQIKAGDQVDKALKQMIAKAFPGFPTDNPLATAGLALIISLIVDNTKYKDNGKAQMVIQGMFDNAALKGIEATGLIEMIEGTIEVALAKI